MKTHARVEGASIDGARALIVVDDQRGAEAELGDPASPSLRAEAILFEKPRAGLSCALGGVGASGHGRTDRRRRARCTQVRWSVVAGGHGIGRWCAGVRAAQLRAIVEDDLAARALDDLVLDAERCASRRAEHPAVIGARRGDVRRARPDEVAVGRQVDVRSVLEIVEVGADGDGAGELAAAQMLAPPLASPVRTSVAARRIASGRGTGPSCAKSRCLRTSSRAVASVCGSQSRTRTRRRSPARDRAPARGPGARRVQDDDVQDAALGVDVPLQRRHGARPRAVLQRLDPQVPRGALRQRRGGAEDQESEQRGSQVGDPSAAVVGRAEVASRAGEKTELLLARHPTIGVEPGAVASRKEPPAQRHSGSVSWQVKRTWKWSAWWGSCRMRP